MATLNIFISSYKKADEKYRVYIRLTQLRKSELIDTPYYVSQSDLNSNREIISIDLIQELRNRISNYAKVLIALGEDADTMDAKQLKDYLIKPKPKTSINLLSYFKTKIDLMQSVKATKTVTGYMTLYNNFKTFLGKDTFYPADFTIHTLINFEHHLRTVPGLRNKTVKGTALRLYMTYLKALTTQFQDEYEDTPFKNPFRKYKLPAKDKPVKRSMDVITLRKLFNAKPADKYEQLALDCFKISFFLCGTNMIDIWNLKKPKRNRIEYERSKTRGKRDDRALISIQVQPELMPLIEKYSDPERCFCFYKMYATHDNLIEAVNNGLKNICTAIGIDTVTTYWARHSWGNIGRNDLHIDFKDISISLNHAQNSVTDKYLKRDFSIVDRCNRKVIDHVLNTKGGLKVVKATG